MGAWLLNLPMKCFGSPVPASIGQRQYSGFVRLVWRFESVWRLHLSKLVIFMNRNDILNREEEILQWIEEEKPKAWIAKQLNCSPGTLNIYLEKMNILYKGQQNKKGQQKGPNKYISAIEYANYPTVRTALLKEKMIKEGLIENKCSNCGLTNWLGQPIVLELHHIDGNKFNNDFNNLQLLCPNCHSLTSNFRGRV